MISVMDDVHMEEKDQGEDAVDVDTLVPNIRQDEDNLENQYYNNKAKIASDRDFEESSDDEMENHSDYEASKLRAPWILCASCERCRARKTKCDGERPCATCVAIYVRNNRLPSGEGVTEEMCDCVYRPAKRRGPNRGTVRKERGGDDTYQRKTVKKNKWFEKDPLQAQIETLQSQLQAAQPTRTQDLTSKRIKLEQQMNLLQQLQKTQQNRKSNGGRMDTHAPQTLAAILGLPKGVKKHLNLLDRNSPEGARLRSFYTLSIDQLFVLPPAPPDEEFFSRQLSTTTASYDRSVLQSAMFAEMALGAFVSDQLVLALELSNATVSCLRECLDSVIPDSHALYLITKAYFLHALFRSYRGDIGRYLQYRRVCLNLIPRMDKDTIGLSELISAISFHDSLAYILHNASEDDLPNIGDVIPPFALDKSADESAEDREKNSNILLQDVLFDVDAIASDPDNQNWIQGVPSIFVNPQAPVLSRCLDALACSVRTCCDQANANQCSLLISDTPNSGETLSTVSVTPTSAAVAANEDELCARNLVKSGYKLLQSHIISLGTVQDNNIGFELLYLIMTTFMEVDSDAGGLGETHTQNLIKACKIVIQNPLLLFQGGPTYHMVSNAAIMLCHVINELHGKLRSPVSDADSSLFDEVLDTFLAVRTLLVSHRKKLPQILRCHGIPRPAALRVNRTESVTRGSELFIDLGETFMCRCSGCQGFVLFGCSPCIAAERALAARKLLNADLNELDMDGSLTGGDISEFDKELQNIGTEFDLDDDTLLSILGKIISS